MHLMGRGSGRQNGARKSGSFTMFVMLAAVFQNFGISGVDATLNFPHTVTKIFTGSCKHVTTITEAVTTVVPTTTTETTTVTETVPLTFYGEGKTITTTVTRDRGGDPKGEEATTIIRTTTITTTATL